MIEIKNISKNFGGFKAVDDVNLNINKGEVRFVIGPNGAGKSTLFKLIIGVHQKSSGNISFNSKAIDHLSLDQRINLGMGVKFQAPSIFHEMTVLENLHISSHKKQDSHLIDEILNDFDLTAEKDQLAGDLSHGKKQWLDIAMASINKPEVVFLDEPTAGLSFEETKKTGEIILNLNKKRGITFIIVEHDMEILKQIASYVSVLHLGKLFFEGSVNEVLNNEQVAKIYLGLN